MSVVSVSLPPSLLLLVSNRVLSLSPFLFSFLCGTSSVGFPFICLRPFVFPCTVYQPTHPHPLLNHTFFFSLLVHVTTTLVYSVALCLCVFSVLKQQRRRGKQRGSTLSVCTVFPVSSSCLILSRLFFHICLSYHDRDL